MKRYASSCVVLSLMVGCTAPTDEPLEAAMDDAMEDPENVEAPESDGESEPDPEDEPEPEPEVEDEPEPLDPNCRLIEGKVWCTPFDESLGQIEGLLIYAQTDYDMAAAMLQEHGLLPMPVLGLDGQTHAMTSLAVLDYQGNELVGPYQEFLLQTFIIDPEHPILEPVDAMELFASLFGGEASIPMAAALHHLTLGSDDAEALRQAVEVGRDYFGFPKFYGEVRHAQDALGHVLEVEQEATQPFGPAALGAFSLRVDLIDGNPIAVPSAATMNFRAVTTGAGYPCWLDMSLTAERLDPHLWTIADSWEATGGLGALLSDLDFSPVGWTHFEQTQGRMAGEQFCEPL